MFVKSASHGASKACKHTWTTVAEISNSPRQQRAPVCGRVREKRRNSPPRPFLLLVLSRCLKKRKRRVNPPVQDRDWVKFSTADLSASAFIITFAANLLNPGRRFKRPHLESSHQNSLSKIKPVCQDKKYKHTHKKKPSEILNVCKSLKSSLQINIWNISDTFSSRQEEKHGSFQAQSH